MNIISKVTHDGLVAVIEYINKAAITSYMKYSGFVSYNLRPLGLWGWMVADSG